MSIMILKTEQNGFTLIETMVAMLVASVVLLGLANMMIMTIRTNQQSEHRMDAVAKAQSILGNIKANVAPNFTLGSAQSLAYMQLCSPGNTGVQGTCPNGSKESIYTPTITLGQSPVIGGLILVGVSLVWQEHGVSKTVSLTSQVMVP